MKKILPFCLLAALAADARFVDPKIEKAHVVLARQETVPGKAASLLPKEKKWTLVWHDEFDGAEIDKTKWMCRESFWGQDFPAFAHDFEGVEMTGETVKLHLLRKGDDFCSPHLQTGSLTYDIPKDSSGFWPFGTYRKPLFMKKYGYFEIRCRLPKNPGWHAAFWFQAPGIGSSPDPAIAGVETDIMENYAQHTEGKIVGGNGWNGYGKNSCWFDHFKWTHEETADGWHDYGCDWTPEGYTFYCDGKKVGEQNYPVSHVEEFLLVSTEPGGYRKVGSDGGLSAGRRTWGKPDERLFQAVLPDFFEVDYVRVYDAAPVQEPVIGRPPEPALRTWVEAAWKRVMEKFYSPKTGGIYVCEPKDVQPARDFPGGLLKPELGYGRGLEDCAINGGTALSGLVDAYAATKDPAYAADAAKIAKGLLNLVNAHPYKGFVARGLCVEDGTSICRLTSRDQVTHWVHGLWRYWRAGLVPDELKAPIREAFADVAGLMERNVTEANGWNFLQADGTPDPRGICKMRETMPHEAARLAMVYAAAGEITGDEKWTKLYRSLREEALDGSCCLANMPEKDVSRWMPHYTLHQMNASLEVLLGVEKSVKFRAKIVSAMVTCARIARERAKGIRGNDSRWLCGCAEVHLAQQMVPPDAFAWGDFQRAILANAIVQTPAGTVGACRAVHLFAAYWRARRLGCSFAPPAAPPAAAATPENGITGHRGDSAHFPENSLAAFAAANAIGADWIETDVHLTKDGQLVLAHNMKTGAYCSQDKAIKDCTYAELAQLDMAEKFRERNRLTLAQCPKVTIVRLEEALDLVLAGKKARLSIQPKCDCVDQVMALVRRKGAIRWVGFNDGNAKWMSRVKELEPSVPVFWDRHANMDVEKDIAFARQHGFETLVLFHREATPERVRRLKAEGFKVGVWTVNAPAEMTRFLDMGIDRIYTDDPLQLKMLKAAR